MDQFMAEAILEAKSGLGEGGIPIGSVLVKNWVIVGRGHNRRVQNRDPVAHAEIEGLRSAGRLASFRALTLYSTLMPCYLCAGGVVQFGIKKVVAGESRNLEGAKSFMQSHGVEAVDLDLPECHDMMKKFISENRDLWNEDIGK